MKLPSAAVALALACIVTLAPVAALQQQAEARTTSPVERVVKLLKDLQDRIKDDEVREQQTYDKYACWCEKTSARKAKAIEKAQATLDVTGLSILKNKGKVATLMSEIEKLASEIAANKKSQAEATAIREKQNAAFMAEADETKQALAALQEAIKVLVEATKNNVQFLQDNTKANIKTALAAMPAKILAGLSPEKAALLQTFATSGSISSYSPQSITIQGILSDMYATFAKDLEHSTKEEADRNEVFENLIASLQAALANMEEVKAGKESLKAETEAILAQESQLYDDVEAQMQADIKFFDATKEACKAKHEEWDDRQTMRAQELEGIKKALEILTTDDARDLFGHTIQAGINTGTFLQLSSKTEPSQSAYEALKAQAMKTHSLRLARIAASITTAKHGHFEKVIKAIDDMIQVLKDEETADIKKKDQCIEEYKKTDSVMANLSWKIDVNKAQIQKFKATLKKLKADLAETNEHIAQTLQEIADMKAQREAENQAYLDDKSDDEQALSLLNQAKAYFTSYYKEHGFLALNQQEAPVFNISADQAPEAEFSSAGHRTNEANDIVQLFDVIIEDVQEEMATSMRLEAEAQLAFEKANTTATELLNHLKATKADLKDSIADTKTLKNDEITDMQGNQASLKNEKDYRKSITPDCDWILGAFDERDKKRAAEMQGLTEAKEFLNQYFKSQTESLAQVNNGGNLRASGRRIQSHAFSA